MVLPGARGIKSESELSALREAGRLSSQLHVLAMTQDLRGMREIDLAKFLISYKKLNKAVLWAYPLIIGSGRRSTLLHARPATKNIKPSDLVLVDMGLKLRGFCSDITRTWPSGAKFSVEQKTIYQIVLDAQKEVIKNVRPGTNLQDLDDLCRERLFEALLLRGILSEKELKRAFPHRTSHWIGRDVHDEYPYFEQNGSPVQLVPGMVFTIEPGIYLGGLDSAYNNIGIRIEDVVVVTKEGCEVLTHAPKEVEEIEWLRARAMRL